MQKVNRLRLIRTFNRESTSDTCLLCTNYLPADWLAPFTRVNFPALQISLNLLTRLRAWQLAMRVRTTSSSPVTQVQCATFLTSSAKQNLRMKQSWRVASSRQKETRTKCFVSSLSEKFATCLELCDGKAGDSPWNVEPAIYWKIVLKSQGLNPGTNEHSKGLQSRLPLEGKYLKKCPCRSGWIHFITSFYIKLPRAELESTIDPLGRPISKVSGMARSKNLVGGGLLASVQRTEYKTGDQKMKWHTEP